MMGNVVLFLIRPGIIDLGAFCVELWPKQVSYRISVPMSYISCSRLVISMFHNGLRPWASGPRRPSAVGLRARPKGPASGPRRPQSHNTLRYGTLMGFFSIAFHEHKDIELRSGTGLTPSWLYRKSFRNYDMVTALHDFNDLSEVR